MALSARFATDSPAVPEVKIGIEHSVVSHSIFPNACAEYFSKVHPRSRACSRVFLHHVFGCCGHASPGPYFKQSSPITLRPPAPKQLSRRNVLRATGLRGTRGSV